MILAEKELRLTGLAVSEGMALARVYQMARRTPYTVPFYTINEQAVEAEQARVRRALEVAAEHLEKITEKATERVGVAQANIFVAQRMMVQDAVLTQEMCELIFRQRVNAENAVEKTLDNYEMLLQEVDDEYLKERATDIGEIKRRLLEILREQESESPTRAAQDIFSFGENRIVVAEELTPTETVMLDMEHTQGLVTERGGPGSHVSILARAMGIPAVTGIRNARNLLAHGEMVLLNGSTGEVIVRPSALTLQVYPSVERTAPQRITGVEPVAALEVLANISLSTEIPDVLNARAEGIGLYRTEFEFFAAGKLLDEDEQYERYATVVKAMQGAPVYFRLLDFGGDKPAPFLDIPREENPCLGYRGARLLQGQPELLITQARALARASHHGPINVIYPMIVDLDQFLVLREIFRQNVQDLSPGAIRHGVMLEVPSACLTARELFEVAEFASIGTNDLIQYLFAVDRTNSLVAKDYGPDGAAFWLLLEQIAAAAAEAGRPVCLCGEMGGQPQYLPRLMALGIRSVSVSARLISLARATARHTPPE